MDLPSAWALYFLHATCVHHDLLDGHPMGRVLALAHLHAVALAHLQLVLLCAAAQFAEWVDEDPLWLPAAPSTHPLTATAELAWQRR